MAQKSSAAKAATVDQDALNRVASNINGQKIDWGTAVNTASTLIKRDRDASTLEVGMQVRWNPDGMQLVTIGNGQILVSTCECTLPSGAVVYRNLYVSTFWKAIPVYDAIGEPVIRNDRQEIVDGTGNAFWEECKNSTYAEVLQKLVNEDGTGKLLKVVEVKRAFGARYIDGEIRGHRITSLPLFEEVSE